MKIKIDPEKQITLYNRDFDEMRRVLDSMIQSIFPRMLDKGMDAASITLKIDFALAKAEIADNNAALGTRPAIHPEVGYKLSVTMQSKDEDKGQIIPYGSDELLMDDDGNFFLVSREEASGQLSMFNSWDEYREALQG